MLMRLIYRTLEKRVHIQILQRIQAMVGERMYGSLPNETGEGYAVNHELGHVLSLAFEQAAVSNFDTDNPNLTPGSTAWNNAWAGSNDFDENEAHANSVGRDVANLLETLWLTSAPTYGYWNGKV